MGAVGSHEKEMKFTLGFKDPDFVYELKEELGLSSEVTRRLFYCGDYGAIELDIKEQNGAPVIVKARFVSP